MLWNHTFYRQPAREVVPGALHGLAVSIRLALNQHPQDRQAVIDGYHAGKLMYRDWVQSLPSPPPPVEFPEGYSSEFLYRFPLTTRGHQMPAIFSLLVLEEYYEAKHQAKHSFAEAMNRVALRRKTNQQYDMFLVYAHRVQGMEVSDDALDREMLGAYARLHIEQMVLEDGDMAADSVAESICIAIDEIEAENRG